MSDFLTTLWALLSGWATGPVGLFLLGLLLGSAIIAIVNSWRSE